MLRWVLLWPFSSGLWIGPLAASDLLPPGFRPVPPGVHALAGGRIVVKPGQALEGATIVIRDGCTKEAGKEVSLESHHSRLYEKYKNRPRPE